MEIQYNELGSGIRLIKLIGNLDIMGVNEIEIKFTGYCSGENARVLVDLSGVDFMASIGIRLLTSNAKSLLSRNGRMVLLNPTSSVREVLEMTGIPDIIPIYEQLESAEAVLLAN
jgi:anti-anti-sigma factor